MLNHMKFPRLVRSEAHTSEKPVVYGERGHSYCRPYYASVYTKQRRKVDHAHVRA